MHVWLLTKSFCYILHYFLHLYFQSVQLTLLYNFYNLAVVKVCLRNSIMKYSGNYFNSYHHLVNTVKCPLLFWSSSSKICCFWSTYKALLHFKIFRIYLRSVFQEFRNFVHELLPTDNCLLGHLRWLKTWGESVNVCLYVCLYLYL